MPEDKDTAAFSGMAETPAPETGDEGTAPVADQPAEEAAQVAAAPERPDDQPAKKADPATDWEQRAKDAQRALAERDSKLSKLEAQVELFTQRLNQQPQTAQTRDMKAEIERLEEDVRNDPANAIRYMHQLMAMRDEYYERQNQTLRAEFERRTVERDPEYKQLEATLKAVQDIPEFAGMPLEKQMEVARRMKATIGGNGQAQRTPPGGLGQQRVVSAPKPVSAEERFKAQLIASGAIRSQAPKGVVSFAFEGRK